MQTPHATMHMNTHPSPRRALRVPLLVLACLLSIVHPTKSLAWNPSLMHPRSSSYPHAAGSIRIEGFMGITSTTFGYQNQDMAFGIFLFRDWVNNMGGICVSGEETDDLACSERRLVSVVITDTTVLGRLDLQRIGSYIRFNLDACAKSEAERPHFLLATYSSTATGHIVDAMDKAGCKIPMLTPGAALDDVYKTGKDFIYSLTPPSSIWYTATLEYFGMNKAKNFVILEQFGDAFAATVSKLFQQYLPALLKMKMVGKACGDPAESFSMGTTLCETDADCAMSPQGKTCGAIKFRFDVDDVKQGTTNMMDILNIVGLVRTGMDKLGVDIDAVIIVVNNAFALVNIMNAVRLTELKAKTITSSSIFEPNPSLMMSSSIAGLVVPVFFNPDDVNRGLSGGRYMGTAVEFKQRIDENYKYYIEPSKAIPDIAGGKDRYETKQYSPSLIALAAGAGLSVMRAIERAKSFANITALNTQLHNLGSCGFSMDSMGRVDNGTTSSCAMDSQCTIAVPGESCKFLDTFIGPLFYADGSTKDKLLGTNTRNALTLAQIQNNTLHAIGPRASRACNLAGPGTCGVMSFMGNTCPCKREYPTFWAWSPQVMGAPQALVQVSWARMGTNHTAADQSSEREWTFSSSTSNCSAQVVTVFQPEYEYTYDTAVAKSGEYDNSGCSATEPGAMKNDTMTEAESKTRRHATVPLPPGPRFRVTARATVVDGACLASKGYYFQAHLIHSGRDNGIKYGRGVDVEDSFLYFLKDASKSSLGVDVPTQWKNAKGIPDSSNANTTKTKTRTIVMSADFDVSFKMTKQLKSGTAYTTMMPTKSGEYDLRVVVTCGPEPAKNLISLGQAVSSGEELLCQKSVVDQGCITFSVVQGCKASEYHTKGMPLPADDPPLQPNGSMGAPAKDWTCEACREGTLCTGGTAVTTSVLPGWFVTRRSSNLTGAEKRPKLWRCPGGKLSCPGGASVTAAMGVVPTTTRTTARTCESMMQMYHTTNSTGRSEFETARLLQYPQCQCSQGNTGMLCMACKSPAVKGGKNWVSVRGSAVGCSQCPWRSDDATSLVVASLIGLLLLVLCVALGWRWYTRPSLVEQRFVYAFRHINKLGIARLLKNYFGVPTGLGITKAVFVAAVTRQCGRSTMAAYEGGGAVRSHGRHDGGVVTAARTKAQVLKLWTKIDKDGDGKVTHNEFVSFICDLNYGTHIETNSKIVEAIIVFARKVYERFDTLKSRTLTEVIITHFQLMSSIIISFPELNVHANGNAAATSITGNAAAATAAPIPNNGTTSVPVQTLAFVTEAIDAATGAVANLNFAALEFVECFVGPRHEHRLLYRTMSAIMFVFVASIVPWALDLIGAKCRKRITPRDANLIDQLRTNCSKIQLLLIFLVYPLLTSTVMRTFLCKEYGQDISGNPTLWLIDDTAIQCDLGNKSGVYLFSSVYALCMIVVVVLGFPTFVFYRLWSWRHPFDRMYFVDEDGRENPTDQAMTDLGIIVTFRSGWWFMAIVDMLFKFIVASCLGVIFQDNQIMGACVAVLCCALIMVFFSFTKPYLYCGGNYLAVVSYGSLLAAFVGTMTDKFAYDGHYVVTESFTNLLFVTWLLPYVVAFADMMNVYHYAMRAASHCRRRGCVCAGLGADGRKAKLHQEGGKVKRKVSNKESKREEEAINHVHTRFTSEHKRGLYILSTFQSLIPIVREVAHAAGVHSRRVQKKQDKLDKQKQQVPQRKGTVAVVREVDGRLRSIDQKHRAGTLRRINGDRSLRRSGSGYDGNPNHSAWDEHRDGAATASIVQDLDARLCSMINAFSNGGTGDRRDNVDGTDHRERARSLTGNYEPLYWSHFIGVELAAKKLSEIAFPITSVDYLISQNQDTDKRGFVRKSFTNRGLLCGKPITEELQREQEDMWRTKAAMQGLDETSGIGSRSVLNPWPDMKHITAWRDVITSLLMPNSDFGWHGSYEGMYDAEIDAPIANLQTNPLQMNPRSFLNVGGPSQDSLPMSEHAAFDGEEKRVVSQISDAGGEGGDESAREGGSETDDIQSDIDRAGRTGSTSFEVGMGNGVDSINLVYANDIEDKIKEKTKKMLGKLGGRSNMVSSRHVGGVKRNPMAGAGRGGSGMAVGRYDDDYIVGGKIAQGEDGEGKEGKDEGTLPDVEIHV